MFNWKLAFEENYKCKNADICTISDIENSGFKTIPATVPGNFELDFMREGLIKDLYFSTNTLDAQKLENLHLWYYSTVKIDDINSYIRFDGIDTIADIYINGILTLSVDNMYMHHDVYDNLRLGENEIVVHIKPVCIYSRQFPVPVASNSLKYGYGALYIRKAASMFGWDIMPRIVSAGIWKPVRILKKKKDQICEVHFITNKIENGTANMRFYINAKIDGDFVSDYSVRVFGKCKDSEFSFTDRLWHNSHHVPFSVENAKLWWPKNAGEQNLYETTVELLYKGEVCDSYSLNVGIRTIELKYSDYTDKDGNGEFCFYVNGVRIFILGTNWVPLDAYHSQDIKRLPKALELLSDIGCNAVRCWGGNVYESEEFYDFCDKEGILVWQDFAMGCAVYPQEDAFAKKLEEEIVYQIKRLRNHTSIALWAGDNECDICCLDWNDYSKRDPNLNFLTRTIVKRAVQNHDYTRPYLPSSPFISEKAYAMGKPTPEDHLWGPRDYFKGDFYRNSVCHFASETGYHAFNSTQSLKKFLKNPERIFKEDGVPTDEYIVHAASMELNPGAPYVYRIKLAYDQVVTLFGKPCENFDDFIKQSQISQAEAKKYFIERFRLTKWRRSGIIWWNLIDGWPQISDAIVDYYYTKKVAYHYVKRSQAPVCLMFDEPKDGYINLHAVNDYMNDKTVEYTVKNVLTDKIVATGKTVACANDSTIINKVSCNDTEKTFYLITWKYDGQKFKNHYFTNIIDIDYDMYMDCMKKCGFDQFEGI